jgi:hypothetical protein
MVEGGEGEYRVHTRGVCVAMRVKARLLLRLSIHGAVLAVA